MAQYWLSRAVYDIYCMALQLNRTIYEIYCATLCPLLRAVWGTDASYTALYIRQRKVMWCRVLLGRIFTARHGITSKPTIIIIISTSTISCYRMASSLSVTGWTKGSHLILLEMRVKLRKVLLKLEYLCWLWRFYGGCWKLGPHRSRIARLPAVPLTHLHDLLTTTSTIACINSLPHRVINRAP